MVAPRYYGLLASLPYLPRVGVGSHAPLSWPALRGQLTTLAEEHRDELLHALQAITWRIQCRDRDELEQSRQLHRLLAGLRDPHLRSAVSFRIDQIVLVAALRRRRSGAGVPESGWGAGRWPFWLRRHWEDEAFGLQQIARWLPAAARCLEEDDAIGLTQLLMNAFWDHLERLTWGQSFAFAEVVAFVFKWDMLRAWATHEPGCAAERFSALANEVTRHVRIA